MDQASDWDVSLEVRPEWSDRECVRRTFRVRANNQDDARKLALSTAWRLNLEAYKAICKRVSE